MTTNKTALVRESLHWPANGQAQSNIKIGVPKEVKNYEQRVSLTPAGVRELTLLGHQVLVERNAASGIGISDDDYRAVGADVVDSAAEVFARADLIVKVKEPQPEEIARLRDGQVLFTYLHLAADKAQTEGLMRSGATCIAYETVTDARGALPLLSPMSEVAGRMSIQVGAHCLEKEQGGAGILLGGVPGVPPANVVVLGGGVSGTNAARMAVGLEANVTIIDQSLSRLKELDLQFGPRAKTLFATALAIETAVLAGGLGDRCRPRARRHGAQARLTRDGARDATRFGPRRHRHRSRRLLRNEQADHPFGTHVRR